jgi:hypothetical protein
VKKITRESSIGVVREQDAMTVVFKSHEGEVNAGLSSMRDAGRDEISLTDLEEDLKDFCPANLELALAYPRP